MSVDDKQAARGCFELIAIIALSTAIGGFYGWPYGVLAFGLAFAVIRSLV